MLISRISPYSKVVTFSCKFIRNFYEFFSIFLVKYFAIKVAIKGGIPFYNGKGGKYQNPEKQSFLSDLALYPLWGCFFTTLLVSQRLFAYFSMFEQICSLKKKNHGSAIIHANGCKAIV
jgi:hypothetical protein